MRSVSPVIGAVVSVLVLVLVLLGQVRPAEACTCRNIGPPCESFWNYDAVFVGKVVALQPLLGHPARTIEATFEVSEAFRGNPGARVVVATESSSSACGYRFARDVEYFVYAHKGGAGYVTSSCTRTRELSSASEDLAYARNLPQRKLAVVEGSVQLSDGEQLLPRRDVTVRVRGTSISALTAGDGRYRLEVPNGTHTLEVADPGARIRGGASPTVTIRDPAACAQRDIYEVWDGQIHGRLLDHTGKPAANVEVSAYAVGGDPVHWAPTAQTDASGRYQIHEVQEGTYFVAVGDRRGGASADQPIPTTFYPGTPTQARAKPIVMKRSGLVTKIDLQLPAPLAIHTISGVVTQKGAPVPDAVVRARNATWPRDLDTQTDTSGYYSFREVAGSEITLELCREDARASKSRPACVRRKHRLTRDLVVDLELPR